MSATFVLDLSEMAPSYGDSKYWPITLLDAIRFKKL